MKNVFVKTFFFSTTQTTKKIVTGIAGGLARMSGGKEVEDVDFTLPGARKEPASFGGQDLVVAGIPVYAGRVPNLLLKYLRTLRGNGARAIAVAVYGNRHYDDALVVWKKAGLRSLPQERLSASIPFPEFWAPAVPTRRIWCKSKSLPDGFTQS